MSMKFQQDNKTYSGTVDQLLKIPKDITQGGIASSGIVRHSQMW